MSPADFSDSIFLTVLAVLTGLAVKILTVKLGIKKLQEQAAFLDELTGRLVVRRSLPQTFARLYVWNLFISFIVITAGLVTFGVLSIIWAFLNLGLFSSDHNVFRRHIHPWLEAAATVLSAALGLWGGQNLQVLLNSSQAFPITAISIIFLLYGAAALLETLEIRRLRGF